MESKKIISHFELSNGDFLTKIPASPLSPFNSCLTIGIGTVCRSVTATPLDISPLIIEPFIIRDILSVSREISTLEPTPVNTPNVIPSLAANWGVISIFANLVDRGISRDLLRDVRAPIGLNIGALTAEEIGISIAAELIAARRGVLAPAGAMSERVAEFFQTGASGPKNP